LQGSTSFSQFNCFGVAEDLEAIEHVEGTLDTFVGLGLEQLNVVKPKVLGNAKYELPQIRVYGPARAQQALRLVPAIHKEPTIAIESIILVIARGIG